MRFFIIQILPFIVISCVSEVDISVRESKKEIAVNCILTTNADTITAWLSYTKPAFSSAGFEPIDNARVVLYEQENPVGQFWQTDSTAWVLAYNVKQKTKYKIEVTTNNTTIWAETTVPEKFNANVSSLEIVTCRYDYQVSFLNNPKNYYWISAKGYSYYKGDPTIERAPAFFSNNGYADDFNRYLETWAGYRYSYEDYIRFAGNTLPPDSINCRFVPATIDINLGPQEVFVFSVDYHLDKYMKSSLLMEENDLWAEDVPIVYAPFPVYSNIHGGTGIFGSFTSVSKVFTKK
jgi:hypothetical protein